MGLFGAPAAKRAKVDQVYAPVKANDVLTLRLLEGARAAHAFPPVFTHQLFGDQEEIAGYRDLRLSLSLCQRTFCALLELQHAKKNVGADDVVTPLQKAFPAGLAQTQEEFAASREAAGAPEWASLGEPLAVSGEGPSRTAVHGVNLSTAHASIRALHARLQPLLLFFVDGASSIDEEDACWDLLLALWTQGDQRLVVGFCTVYSFYVYPSRTRMRVSQVLVLPPYERQGVGRALLAAVYALADSRGALDVTYEDPTLGLQRQRCRVELERAAALSWLCQLAAESAAAALAAARKPAPPGKGPAPAAGPGGKENSRPGSQPQPEPLSSTGAALAELRLSPAEGQRLHRELRVGRKAVTRLWELLLWRQSSLRTPEGRALMQELVRDRLAAATGSKGRPPTAKRIVNGPTHRPNDFVMMRAVPGQGAGAEPVAVDEEGAQALSGEQAEQELRQATQESMDFLKAVTQLP